MITWVGYIFTTALLASQVFVVASHPSAGTITWSFFTAALWLDMLSKQHAYNMALARRIWG